MSWLDAILDRTREARSVVPIAPVAVPQPEPKPDIKLVWFQIRPSRGADDLGMVEAAYYSVTDSVLTMHDESGKPTGQTRRLGKEDAQKVAGRLGLAAWVKNRPEDSAFNGPLNYQPLGLA